MAEGLPPLVARALVLAERLCFERPCRPEVGRLLAALAAQQVNGRVGELGSGCGVGAAWIVSALPPSATFVTVEADGERARAVHELFAGRPNVAVLHGDWTAALAYGPFTLLFADVAAAKQDEPERLLAALRPGRTLLLDDLTPQRLGTAEQRARWNPDPVCAFWFRHPRVAPASGVPDATPVASGRPSAVLLTTAAGRLSGGPARGRRSAAALGAATAQVAGASGRRSTATRSAPAGSGREGLPLSPGRAALPPWSAPGQADA